MEMTVKIREENDDIIEVAQACLPYKTMIDTVHHPLKSAGVLQRPNGITVNSYKQSGVTEAVFKQADSAVRICQYRTVIPVTERVQPLVRNSGYQ